MKKRFAKRLSLKIKDLAEVQAPLMGTAVLCDLPDETDTTDCYDPFTNDSKGGGKDAF